MAVIAPRIRPGRFELRFRPTDPFLLVPAVLGGLALTVATTPLGGGDYGQWLMTARPFAGESIPDYRAAGAVPPLVPFLLGSIMSLVGDPFVAIRLFTVLLLCALGASAYTVGATLFRSPRTGLLVTVLALLAVDQFLDLFAFGGLLQAMAIALACFAVAAFVRAADDPERERAWWTLGAICDGLIALTHMGSAYIFVPTGCAVAVLAVRKAVPGRQARARRLAPLGVALIAAAAFWLLVLLPDSTDLIRNPASLSYRGPGRLLESLTENWSTAVVAVGGLAAIVAGTVAEIRRSSQGPWIILATWTAITLAVALGAVVTGAATDYPRFATPILAPLVIGAGAALSIGIGIGSRWLADRTGAGSPAGWSVVALAAIIVVSIPMAADRFLPEANGYRLQDADGLASAATWIDSNLEPDATILAPVREAKWIEGLTGRAALFSNPVRYSFRAEEWQRSLAADALLRSNGALANPFFVARLTAAGTDQSAARGVVVAANHGGEYVDLLTTVPEQARIVGAGADGPTLATLANLAPAGREVAVTDGAIQVVSTWTGDRQGAPVTYRQSLGLDTDSSVLDFRATVETTVPVGGLQIELRPPSGTHITAIDVVEQEATLSFSQIGSAEPQLRILVVGGEGYLRPTAAGGLVVRTMAPELRLLITDLSAGDSAISNLQWLDPATLIETYGVDAVLLARNPSLDARQPRMEALGFHMVRDFSSYLLLAR
jgi:hypothetical protein